MKRLFLCVLFALLIGSLWVSTSPAQAAPKHVWVGDFIDQNILPANSVLTGDMFVELRDHYGIPIVDALVLLKIESNLGAPNWATTAHAFGCVKYFPGRTAIMGTPTPGTTWHWGSRWYSWKTAAQGMNGWGAFVHNWGSGSFLAALKRGDWTYVAKYYNGGSRYADWCRALDAKYTAMFRATGQYPLTTAGWTP